MFKIRGSVYILHAIWQFLISLVALNRPKIITKISGGKSKMLFWELILFSSVFFLALLWSQLINFCVNNRFLAEIGCFQVKVCCVVPAQCTQCCCFLSIECYLPAHWELPRRWKRRQAGKFTQDSSQKKRARFRSSLFFSLFKGLLWSQRMNNRCKQHVFWRKLAVLKPIWLFSIAWGT